VRSPAGGFLTDSLQGRRLKADPFRLKDLQRSLTSTYSMGARGSTQHVAPAFRASTRFSGFNGPLGPGGSLWCLQLSPKDSGPCPRRYAGGGSHRVGPPSAAHLGKMGTRGRRQAKMEKWWFGLHSCKRRNSTTAPLNVLRSGLTAHNKSR
jgi:hypothetical protein